MMDYYDKLARWNEVRRQIRVLQDEERELRQNFFSGAFPTPREGVNSINIPPGLQIGDLVTRPGSKLKGTYKINRNVQREVFDALEGEQRSLLITSGIIVLKPEVGIKSYRDATGELLDLANKVIESKPGLPDLEIHIPEEKEKK